ncbi:site-specific integrase [Dactylosporangium salmoneum]|uniref:site-specific integrase n=1 Tax=Dactylosporangium salmoneum TaxID=53361 RepID=UPI0031D03859
MISSAPANRRRRRSPSTSRSCGKAASEGSRRAYSTYWDRVLEHWSQRRIDEVRPSDIERLAEHVKANRVQRRTARGGHGSAENLISALRCLYRRAVADGPLSDARIRR